jgi:uncharacterized phage protein (TIGR02218 family)
MKNVSTQLRALINLEGVNLCRLWTITLVNGEVLRFTDLNVSINYAGNRYAANPGVTVSAIQTELNGGPSDAEINFTLNDLFLTKEMARRGSLDRAQINVIQIDYLNPTVGNVPLFVGIVREVDLDDPGRCTLSVGGTLMLLDVRLIERYSETCRNALGDARCGIDIETLGVDFTVAEVAPRGGWFTAFELTQATGFWQMGKVIFNSGNSTGQTYEIGSFAQDDVAGKAFFLLKTRFKVEPGDTGRIYPGCNKYIGADCFTRFNNVRNFRGEPFVPNLDFDVSSDIVTTVTTRQTGTVTNQVVVSDQLKPITYSFYVIKK